MARRRTGETIEKVRKLIQSFPNWSTEGENVAELAAAATVAAIEVKRLSVLNQIGQALSSASALKVEEILELIFEQTGLLMYTQNFYVALFNPADDFVTFPFVIDDGERKEQVDEWAPRKAGRGLTEYIIRHGKPLLIEKDCELWLLEHEDDVDSIGQCARSWLGVPMLSGNEVLGVIALQDYEENCKYQPGDLEVLSTIASQAAIAIQNAKLLQSARTQVEELRLLREVGQVITSTIDREEVLQRVVKGARSVLGADIAALYPIVDDLFQPPVIDGKLRGNHELDPMPRDRGVAARVLETGFVVVNDVEREPQMRSRFAEVESICSFAGVALKVGGSIVAGELSGGDCVGVLYIDFREHRCLDEDERNTVLLFAIQAAIAISNAQLYAASEKKTREIERLAKTGEQLLASPADSRRALQEIAEQALDTLGADLVVLYLYREAEQEFEVPPICAGTLLEPEFPEHLIVEEDDIASRIARRRKPVFVSESGKHELLVSGLNSRRPKGTQPFRIRERVVSVAGIPLKVAGEMVGVLFVNYREEKNFSSHHRSMIETFANYAAIAIQNSRLFEEVRSALDRRIEELNALLEIDETIMTMDLDAVLKKSIEAACTIVGAPNGNILLVDESGDFVELKAIYGRHWVKDTQTKFQIGKHGVTGWVAEHKQTVRIDDVQEGQWKGIYIEALSETCSELAVPLLDDKSALIGIINLESPVVGAFSTDDERLLEALAAQATIAIQNHRSFEAALRARHESEVLAEIDRAISSTLDPGEVLNLILDEGLALVGAPYGNIMLLDEITEELRLAVGRGTIPTNESAIQRIGEGVVGLAAEARVPYSVPDVTEAPWQDIYIPFIEGIRSELAVPMTYNGILVGVLNAESTDPAAFGEDDTRILQALASRAVLAIQNAKLYSESQQATERFQILFEAGKSILQGPLEVNEVLGVPLLVGIGRVGAHAATAWLLDETGEHLHPVSPLGEACEMELPPIDVAQPCANSWVARHRETLVVADVEEPPKDITYTRGHPSTRSELIVPLMVHDTYLGNLDFGHPEKGAFSADEVKLIEGLADQAAAALQRIRQTEELEVVRERDLQLQLMGSIGQSALEIAHRIGNQVGPVKSYVNLVREEMGVPSETTEWALGRILKDTGALSDMSERLKAELSRLGEISEKEIVPANDLLLGCVEAYTGPLDQVEVSIDCTPETLCVLGRSDQLFHLFYNLFSNAVEALGNGQGRIVLKASSNGQYVEFVIEDTGVGIAPDRRDRIFDLFYSTKEGGLGFGLWSAKQTVLSHEGLIDVRSELGRGTVFSIRLPMAQEEVDND